eukprot:8078661-Karenia_brevis.AAC.1
MSSASRMFAARKKVAYSKRPLHHSEDFDVIMGPIHASPRACVSVCDPLRWKIEEWSPPGYGRHSLCSSVASDCTV